MVTNAGLTRERAPGIALTLRAAPFAEGLRLLVRGESDLHCGGADPSDPLPAFLRRERFPDTSRRHRHRRGPSAARGHSRTVPVPRRPRRLAVDRLRPARPRPPAGAAIPRHRPARRDRAPGRRRRLFPMATGPWLACLPLAIGRRRCRTGFVARRTAEDLEPFRLLEQTLRDCAIERHAPQDG